MTHDKMLLGGKKLNHHEEMANEARMAFAQFEYLRAIHRIAKMKTFPAETVRIMGDEFYANLKAAAL
jgi:hypothetical protein